MLTLADWVILGVLALSAVVSARRGFVTEAISLGTWLAAVFVAWLFGGELGAVLSPYIDTPSIRLGVASIVLFLGVLMLGSFVGQMLGEAVKAGGLDGPNRLLGVAFGLGKGVILVSVVIAALYYLAPVKEDRWWRESVLISTIVPVVETLAPPLWGQGAELLEELQAGKVLPKGMPGTPPSGQMEGAPL